MKLLRISLRDFRGVTDATVEFTSGVTVVEGPNEVGKSSVAEAIRLLRDRNAKATSRRKEIQALQPVGRDVGPFAEVELHTGPYHLTYRKRWLRSPLTELIIHSPQPAQLSGDSAHDRFEEILSETTDRDLLQALDVTQGRSLEQPGLAQVNSLRQALDDSSVAFESHDALLARIDTEYQRFFTATGRDAGELRAARARQQDAQQQIAGLTARSDEAQELVLEHDRHTRRLTDVNSEWQRAEEVLADLQQRSATFANLRHTADQANQAQLQAQRDLDAALAAQAQRNELVAEVAQRRENLTQAEASARSVREQLDVQAGSQDAQRAQFAEAEEAIAAQRNRLRTLQEQRELRRDRVRLIELQRRLEHLHQIDRTIEELSARNAALTITEADLAELHQLASDVKVAEHGASSAAPRVKVQVESGAYVLLDDEPVEAGSQIERSVHQPMTVTIPGQAAITVEPADSAAASRARLAEATGAFRGRLDEIGLPDLESARTAVDERRDLSMALKAQQTLRGHTLGDETEPDLKAAVHHLQQRMRAPGHPDDHAPETPSNLDAPSDPETGTAPDSPEHDDTIAQLSRELAAAEQELTHSSADLKLLDVALAELQERAIRGESAVEAARAESQRAEQRLTQARKASDDADLETTADAASEQLAARLTALTAARTALESADVERFELELRNTERLVLSKQTERDDLRGEVHRLGALVDDRIRDGLFDQLTEAQAVLEAAEAELERAEAQADAIALLRETLLRHRDQAQARYVAPFEQQISRWGRMIWGSDFSVQVSPELEIESRTVAGTTVPFDSLSAGAREQLSLLGRVAVAGLVAPDDGAPLVLDDALGFADPERLAALNLVLGDVGQRAQIIILTCQPGRFATLGGASVVRLTSVSAT